MKPSPAMLAAAAAAFAAGCCGMCNETTRSENVRTEGLAAHITVEAKSARETFVSAKLRVGGPLSNLYPEIGGSDRLEAVNGADTVALTLSKHLLGAMTYDGALPGDSGGRTVAMRFLRVTNTSALGTHVDMPASFAVTSPAEDDHFSAARPSLVVTWAPPLPGSITWVVRGSCIFDQSGGAPDDGGRLPIVLAAAPAPDGGAPRTSCKVTILLERTARGVVDPAFGEGGSITATQTRERSVWFAP